LGLGEPATRTFSLGPVCLGSGALMPLVDTSSAAAASAAADTGSVMATARGEPLALDWPFVLAAPATRGPSERVAVPRAGAPDDRGSAAARLPVPAMRCSLLGGGSTAARCEVEVRRDSVGGAACGAAAMSLPVRVRPVFCG
jgi:hypothetical protein